MLEKDIPAAAMLEAENMLYLWATSEGFTLYCGPETEREAALLQARYPRHRGRVEFGAFMEPGTMAITKELSVTSGVLPSRILLDR